MKNGLLVILLLVFVCKLSGQTAYDETESIVNLPSGIIYQSGPGDNNTKNWTYPYSTKLTINGGIDRNFEFASIGKDNESFVIRQFSHTTNNWTVWRKIILDDGNGNIGIGTTNPNEKLALSQGNLEFEMQTNTMHSWGEEIQSIDFAYRRSDAPQSKIAKIVLKNYNTEGTGWYAFTDRYDAGLSFYTTNNNNLNESMTITGEGKVGIGTDNPKAKLSVNGTIISTEIKVLADINQYPDFVFSNNYKIRSLKEVEKYIEENKHLPDIPKADEVNEGIALGEMNTKLLLKIEELTLYVIDQNKKLEQQNARIEQQDQELKVMKEELEKMKDASN